MPKIKDGRIIDDPVTPEKKTGPTYHLRQPIKKRRSLARRWSREARRLIGPLGGPGSGAGFDTKAIVVTAVAAALILAFVLAAIFLSGGKNTDPSQSDQVVVMDNPTG